MNSKLKEENNEEKCQALNDRIYYKIFKTVFLFYGHKLSKRHAQFAKTIKFYKKYFLTKMSICI
jgi:hypothetical protein